MLSSPGRKPSLSNPDTMSDPVAQYVETLPFKRTYILSAADEATRYTGSSGGVVTALARYLFKNGRINSAICFRFSGRDLFNPDIVFAPGDYQQTGSIYHHVHLIRYLRENVDRIQSPLLVTCLPCECKAIRRLLTGHQIETVMVSLVCSGQLTKQATYDFLARHGIDIDRVQDFCYRGRGWPSGITVRMQDGTEHFFHNTDSDWICFFHSTIYNLQRCFRCPDTFGAAADISVADPWFKEYVEKETVGCTVLCTTEAPFIELIEQMITEGVLKLHERIELSKLAAAQYWTVAKKQSFRQFRFLQFLIRLFRTPFYRRLFLTGRYCYLHYKWYMKLLGKYKRKLNAQHRHH